jgi:hypothetical protein
MERERLFRFRSAKQNATLAFSSEMVGSLAPARPDSEMLSLPVRPHHCTVQLYHILPPFVNGKSMNLLDETAQSITSFRTVHDWDLHWNLSSEQDKQGYEMK